MGGRVKKGVMEGMAVVVRLGLGEAGVEHGIAGALCCGVPWGFLSKLLF